MRCDYFIGNVSAIQPAPNNGLNSDELREALLMMMKSRDEVAETNRCVVCVVCVYVFVCIFVYVGSMCVFVLVSRKWEWPIRIQNPPPLAL